MPQQILIIGAGQIGSFVAFLLASTPDYHVTLADSNIDNTNITRLPKLKNLAIARLDAQNATMLEQFLQNNTVDAVVSSLPYFANIPIATAAKKFNLHYFDLTEDVKTTEAIAELARNAERAFVPQCGLAPGFISIIAHHLIQKFPAGIDAVKMCVGALPMNVSNELQYSLTWSIDGLINEYGNPCPAIVDGQATTLMPLDDLEEIKIDGLTYEAFNTSGGAGSLVNSYLGKVHNLSYKTIRYPGHCNKMRFLMQDLKLNADRKTLKHILEHAIPSTYQDVVLVYVSVTGKQGERLLEENYVKKFYSQTVADIHWTAIQMTTGSGICAVIDMVLRAPEKYKGLVRQEEFKLAEVLGNRFGGYFKEGQ